MSESEATAVLEPETETLATETPEVEAEIVLPDVPISGPVTLTVGTDYEIKSNLSAALQSEIDDQRCIVADLSVALRLRISEAKSAKKELKEAVDELVELEGRMERGEFSLPFTGAAAGDAPATSTGSTDTLPGQKELPLTNGRYVAPEIEQKLAASEPWRAVTLAELGIDGKLAESLTEAGMTTLGAIADYSKSDKLLTDLDGIGPAKSEKIEQACEAYWDRAGRISQTAVSAVPAELTSTTTPAGIAAHDPDVVTTDLTVTAAIDTCDELLSRCEARGIAGGNMAERLRMIRLSIVESGKVESGQIGILDAYGRALADPIDPAEGVEDASLTEAYAAGCAAACGEKPVSDNPHKRGTQLWRAWDRGWQETEAA